MEKIRIRSYCDQDITNIRNLLKLIGWAEKYVEGQILFIQKLTANEMGEIKIADLNNTVVGFIQAEHLKWNNLTHIHGLVVHPNYRRMKIAQSLVSSVEESAKKNCNRGIYLDTPTTNQEARLFYSAIGMNEAYIMPSYYEPKLDGVTYQKFF